MPKIREMALHTAAVKIFAKAPALENFDYSRLSVNHSHVPYRRHGSKKFNTGQKGHQFLGLHLQ